jgi:hypothetical protein
MSVAKKQSPRFHVGDVVAFLYGPQKVPGEILEDRGPLGLYGHRIYRVRLDRGQEDAATLEVPESNILGPWLPMYQDETPGNRQEFNVTYTRKGNTRSWSSSVNRGRLYKGIRAKGAVGYTNGEWEGERKGSEKRAMVTVFMECDDATTDAGHARVVPVAWSAWEERARTLADEMFKSRHPDAVIDHTDDLANH